MTHNFPFWNFANFIFYTNLFYAFESFFSTNMYSWERMQKKIAVNAAISLTAAILGHGRLEVGTENRE